MHDLNIAIVGATGTVGEMLLTVLQERAFPINNLYLLASERSAGKTLSFNNREIAVDDVANFDFSQVDIAFFSAGSEVSKQYVPKAADAGCISIDNTSHFRYEADIPLVVPEVNTAEIANYTKRNIIANPNCSTIQMVMVLKPLYDAAGIERVNVVTYQSVSGTGKRAINELISQISELLNGRPGKSVVYQQQIAFNVLPYIGEINSNGYSQEEMKMIWETKKILNDDNILVNATTVRVPVLYGHSEAVHLELKKPLKVDAIRKLLRKAPGIKVVDDRKKCQFPTPITHAIGCDEVFVGRIRQDISHKNGVNLWVVADNIRKGAATNAVQIAEILHRDYL